MCREEVIRSEDKLGFPMYGPWMLVARPKPYRASVIGGAHAGNGSKEQNNKWKSWFDIMSEAKEGGVGLRKQNRRRVRGWNKGTIEEQETQAETEHPPLPPENRK